MDIISAVKLLSPLDVVVLTVECKEIVKKSEIEKLEPASILFDKAEKLVLLGDYATRNPTYWNVTQGAKKEDTPEWEKALVAELSRSKLDVKVTDLDNNSNVVDASCEVYLLAINCDKLTKEYTKEIKCAKAHTAFGPIELQP